MKDIAELRAKLEGERPVSWEQLPDIPLYMDQVMSYMPRQLIDLAEDGDVTASMMHNYAKEGLLPRSAGKRYSREHIAYLTAICLLKQVLQVHDVKTLLRESIDEDIDVQGVYAEILDMLDSGLSEAAGSLPADSDRTAVARAALKLAVSAYTQQLACRELVRLLGTEDEK
jgi:DNA-binding transcriptional MerR regulator